MAFVDVDGIRVCRTGYTGEHGYELLVPADDAAAVWDACCARPPARAVRPGARDTLRTEMGYPLHGQDLAGHHPVQAGSGWAVGWSKPEFWGRDALLAEKAAGPARRLRGLRATGRGVPRPGMACWPTARASASRRRDVLPDAARRHRAGAARQRPWSTSDDAVAVDVRGRALACTVVKPPFVPSHVR
jgi:aminomethyltransferase